VGKAELWKNWYIAVTASLKSSNSACISAEKK